MKRIVIGLCVCLVIGSSVNAQVKKFQDLQGHWLVGGEQGAALVIIDSANVVLSYMGEVRNVSDIKIDFTKSPCWFDFTAKDSTSSIYVKSLVEISGEGVLKWQLFIDEERPAHFVSNKGELLYLKRSRSNASPVIAAKAGSQ